MILSDSNFLKNLGMTFTDAFTGYTLRYDNGPIDRDVLLKIAEDPDFKFPEDLVFDTESAQRHMLKKMMDKTSNEKSNEQPNDTVIDISEQPNDEVIDISEQHNDELVQCVISKL